MTCELEDEDCGADHVAPILHLRCTGKRQWAGACPVCKHNLTLGVGTKGRRFVWTCWRKPARGGQTACTDSGIREAMLAAGISEQCLTSQRGRHRGAPSTAELTTIRDIATDKALSPTARQMALLMVSGMSAAEARGALKLARSTYYDAMKALGSRPRQSENPDSAAGQGQSENPDY